MIFIRDRAFLWLPPGALGFAATVGTQVMVARTGTDAFCGNACHSM
ncbi:MAG: hypothetical protein ACRET6_08985 [Burkholderiales bacterium]